MITTNGQRWLGRNERTPMTVATIDESVSNTNVYCATPPRSPVTCAAIQAPPTIA